MNSSGYHQFVDRWCSVLATVDIGFIEEMVWRNAASNGQMVRPRLESLSSLSSPATSASPSASSSSGDDSNQSSPPYFQTKFKFPLPAPRPTIKPLFSLPFPAPMAAGEMSSVQFALASIKNQPFRKSKPRAVLTSTYCKFCKCNNESEVVFKSHVLYDPFGKVSCPVLRAYNCPLCNNGGGDDAHTTGHCPKRLNQNLNPPTVNHELTATGRRICRRRVQ